MQITESVTKRTCFAMAKRTPHSLIGRIDVGDGDYGTSGSFAEWLQ